MALADTLNRKPGDILKSDDWNVIIKEIDRLEKAKINRDGADTLKGPLTIAGALNANSDVTMKGSLSIVVPQLQDQIIEALVLGPTNASNLRLGYHQDYSLIQSHGSKPLLINGSGNNVGIGSTKNPVAKLDIASATRTGTHPTAVKGLYITGDFKDDSDGVEFRHTNGTQGIGFGSNTIYAAGSNANQHLGLKAKGTGEVQVTGKLSVTGSLSFGSQTRQMLNLWGTGHGIGVQNNTTYFRTSDNFAWYKGGSHYDAEFNAGTNGTSLMTLDGSGNLSVLGTISPAGTESSKDLGLKAKGTGEVKVFGKLLVTGNLTVSGKVNDRDISADGGKLDTHTHNGTDSQKVKHSDLTLDGGTNPHKTTAADVGALSTSGGTVNGNLVIGTTDTIKGKLHIEGSVNYTDSRKYRWFNIATDSNIGSKAYACPYSLYASNYIGCEQFNAFSDLRIKEIKGTSDSQADLQTLLQIQVTDYYYKDKIAKGNKPKKKVIGQQIATVYPQAVSTHVDTVPDIFESAIIEENWVTLNSHNLKIGDKVKIFWNDNDSQLFTVEDIKTDKFKISLNHTGDIFVYGREVDDFHVVDYDALSMLHISATQELYKIIKKLEQKLNEKIKD